MRNAVTVGDHAAVAEDNVRLRRLKLRENAGEEHNVHEADRVWKRRVSPSALARLGRAVSAADMSAAKPRPHGQSEPDPVRREVPTRRGPTLLAAPQRVPTFPAAAAPSPRGTPRRTLGIRCHSPSRWCWPRRTGTPAGRPRLSVSPRPPTSTGKGPPASRFLLTRTWSTCPSASSVSLTSGTGSASNPPRRMAPP